MATSEEVVKKIQIKSKILNLRETKFIVWSTAKRAKNRVGQSAK